MIDIASWHSALSGGVQLSLFETSPRNVTTVCELSDIKVFEYNERVTPIKISSLSMFTSFESAIFQRLTL